jgi:DNA-3-methyladenine glycosylase II
MDYITHLHRDTKLKKIVLEPLALSKRENVYLHLCRSIVSQQLSTKVAAIIWNRFLELYPTNTPSPDDILNMAENNLRSVGLSASKAQYIKAVAQFAKERGMEDKQIQKMSNEEVIAYLTQIKGVGKWTVEMLLMFTLGRPDVFAVDDLGIQQAMTAIYKLDNSNKKELKAAMVCISQKWAPYRTYACLHLWRWKDQPLP